MSSISVLIETKNLKPAGKEESMIEQYAKDHGYTIHRAALSQLRRDRFKVTSEMIVSGSVGFVKQALRHVGTHLPIHRPYPDELSHLLYREVRYLHSLIDAKLMVAKGESLFVKPAEWKRFTGFVPEYEGDYRFNGASNYIPVWISTVVNFVSEWRFYVVDGQLLSWQLADHGGDINVKPDLNVALDAIEKIHKAGKYPSAYVIDFGVLDTGQTALVEMNDGFSFGAYGDLTADVLWQVTSIRWKELVNEVQPIQG